MEKFETIDEVPGLKSILPSTNWVTLSKATPYPASGSLSVQSELG